MGYWEERRDDGTGATGDEEQRCGCRLGASTVRRGQGRGRDCMRVNRSEWLDAFVIGYWVCLLGWVFLLA